MLGVTHLRACATCFRLQLQLRGKKELKGGEVIYCWEIFTPFDTSRGFFLDTFFLEWGRMLGNTMTEDVGSHVIVTTALTSVLLMAVVVLLCYFTCRLAGSLPLGGPGRF